MRSSSGPGSALGLVFLMLGAEAHPLRRELVACRLLPSITWSISGSSPVLRSHGSPAPQVRAISSSQGLLGWFSQT
jgi:hypothetical protein